MLPDPPGHERGRGAPAATCPGMTVGGRVAVNRRPTWALHEILQVESAIPLAGMMSAAIRFEHCVAEGGLGRRARPLARSRPVRQALRLLLGRRHPRAGPPLRMTRSACS
jgi:hypothetical protein